MWNSFATRKICCSFDWAYCWRGAQDKVEICSDFVMQMIFLTLLRFFSRIICSQSSNAYVDTPICMQMLGCILVAVVYPLWCLKVLCRSYMHIYYLILVERTCFVMICMLQLQNKLYTRLKTRIVCISSMKLRYKDISRNSDILFLLLLIWLSFVSVFMRNSICWSVYKHFQFFLQPSYYFFTLSHRDVIMVWFPHLL